MVNDNTIDARSARYWCAFADKEIAKLLDKAAAAGEKDGHALQKVVKAVEEKKETLAEGMFDWAQAAHQAAFPMATGNPFQPNFRCLDPSSGVPSLQDQQRNNIIAGAAAAAIVGGYMAPGAWTALCAAVGGALATLGPAAAWLSSTAASIGTAGVMAIVGGLVSVSTYLYPRIAKLINDVCRKGVVAKCLFEADGQEYEAVFSLSDKRWRLLYGDNRWIRGKVHPGQEDVAAFFDSGFFKKFLAQCGKYVDVLYSDGRRLEALKALSEMTADESRGDMKKLLDAKDDIDNYMLKGMYATN